MARRERVVLTDGQRRTRRLVWVVAASAIVLISLVGLGGSLLSLPSPTPSTETVPPTAAPTPVPTVVPGGVVVDPTVTERGFLPEPITTDWHAYGIAAALAGSSYDTTRATREQLLQYLASWHTLDPRYDLVSDQQDALQGKLDELNQRVIVPAAEWSAQAENDVVVTAQQDGAVLVDYDHLSVRPGALDALIAAGYHTVTTSIVADYSGRDATHYQERFTVSVQVLCGGTTPAAGSGQTSADCKLIRFFPEAMS